MDESSYLLLMEEGPEPGRRIALAGETIVLGRSPEADVRIDDGGVSREHARLLRTESGYEIQDRGSMNGTFVDDRRLGGRPVALSEGQTIRLGANVLLVYRAALPGEVLPELDEGLEEEVPLPELPESEMEEEVVEAEQEVAEGIEEEPPATERLEWPDLEAIEEELEALDEYEEYRAEAEAEQRVYDYSERIDAPQATRMPPPADLPEEEKRRGAFGLSSRAWLIIFSIAFLLLLCCCVATVLLIGYFGSLESTVSFSPSLIYPY